MYQFHCGLEPYFRTDEDKVAALLYQNYSIPLHMHEFYEINIVMAGSGVHQIERGEVNVGTGDVFVIPPRIVHGYKNTRGLDVYHLLLNPHFVEEMAGESRRVKGYELLFEIEPLFRKNLNKSCFLQLSPGEFMLLKPQLEALLAGGAYDYPDAELMKAHQVMMMIYWFAHLLEKQIYRQENKRLIKNEQSVIKALDYIHKNYSQKITIEMLCGEAFLSRSTFIRNFKSVSGKSPMEYLQDYRCMLAVRLLREGQLKRTEVAYECGFYDYSHMKKALASKEKSKGSIPCNDRPYVI